MEARPNWPNYRARAIYRNRKVPKNKDTITKDVVIESPVSFQDDTLTFSIRGSIQLMGGSKRHRRFPEDYLGDNKIGMKNRSRP